MLRKKLDKIICSPRVINVTAGITSRNVVDGLSGPKKCDPQELRAYNDNAIPATKSRLPTVNPVSSLTYRNNLPNRGSSGSNPSLTAKTLVKRAKTTVWKPITIAIAA
jgi:hypothetical protein